MKLKLFPKLFLAFLLTTAVLVLGMAWSAHWTFKQGLRDYLHSKEMEQFDKLIPAFEDLYIKYGGWELLRGNHFLFREAVHSALGPPKTPPFDAPPHPPPPGHRRGGDIPPPPEHQQGGGSLPPPPPSFLSVRSRLAIFDAAYQLVIGREADLPRDSLRPLQQDGKVIGWIGVSRHHQIEDHLAQAFQNQQAYNYIVIAVLALLISGLAAWLLVTQLLAPVRRITVGAHSLSKGEYQTRIKVDSRDELGKLAEDFNHLAHSLERNEQVRRQWIADISHELRTPLAVLRGEIEAMQDGVRDFTPQNLKSLHGETLGLAKLVDDLYDLALSDIGALDYRREPVNVVDILHDSTNAFNPRFAVKNIQLDNCVTGEVILFADSHRLSQLLSNLLENSLRYTDNGGRLIISLEQSEKNINLLFEDSAPGVPEEALEHLFERLYRLEKSRSRALGGAGLGLSICRNIVTAHAGEISASPSKLGGLCVRVCLPHYGH